MFDADTDRRQSETPLREGRRTADRIVQTDDKLALLDRLTSEIVDAGNAIKRLTETKSKAA